MNKEAGVINSLVMPVSNEFWQSRAELLLVPASSLPLLSAALSSISTTNLFMFNHFIIVIPLLYLLRLLSVALFVLFVFLIELAVSIQMY